MQLMTVSCQICGRVIMTVEKDQVADQDLTDAVGMCSCEVDGQQTMSNGQPNIVAVRTNE